MSKPFRKILVKLILEKAIMFEENAYRFYESAISMTASGDAADLLNKLLAAELRHRLKLEEIQNTGELETKTAYISGRDKLDQDEELDMISRGWPVLNPRSSREEILEVALAREKSACSFYNNLYEKSRIKIAEELFGMLAREESEHVIWISEVISGITR